MAIILDADVVIRGDMPDERDVILRAGRTILPERVHPYIGYVEFEGVFIDLELECHDPSLPGAD